MAYVKDYTAQVRIVKKVSDGDTYWLWGDPGYRTMLLMHIRLDGYDTPESRSPASAYEKAQAYEATKFATEWFQTHMEQGHDLWVRTKPDPQASLDRWVGEVWAETPNGSERLGEALLAANLAVLDPGGKVTWHSVHDPRRDRVA